MLLSAFSVRCRKITGLILIRVEKMNKMSLEMVHKGIVNPKMKILPLFNPTLFQTF